MNATIPSKPKLPTNIGPTAVKRTQPATLIGNATGFVKLYDGVVNPYQGCSFACDYCYASNFAPSEEHKLNWGNWVFVKSNAPNLLSKTRPGVLNGKTLYVSTATDPYQPIERTAGITKALLETVIERHPQAKLVIQTRAPMVTRDIALFQQIEQGGGRIQVNMTVTTDDDAIRRTYEPRCPSIPARLKAVAQLNAAGIQTCITMTPLLPTKDIRAFAQTLLATGTDRYIAQDFHLPDKGDARMIARTDARAIAATATHFGCDPAQAAARYNRGYARDLAVLKTVLPNLGIGRQGFAPPF